MGVPAIFLIVAAGFALLVKGADLLVEGASSAAKRMHVSELTIGLTVVAIGTSMPELVVNVLSAFHNYNDVVFGNIIGSNAFNTLVILGIAGAIYPMTVKSNTVWREIPFAFLITLLLFVMVNDTLFWASEKNRADRVDGGVLLTMFILFMLYIFRRIKYETAEHRDTTQMLSTKSTTIYLLAGIAGISLGGHLVVDYAVQLAAHYHISEKLVGLTVISAGTSLPELATTVVAAFRQKSDIAIGNILGSNIFNVTLVLGITSLIQPVEYATILNTDIFVLLGTTLMLFVFMFTLTRKKLDRWEAIVLLILSICYLYFVFQRG